jgi:hypothetical protein
VFSAQVVGDPAAAIYQVWVTYTSAAGNAWTSLDLSQCVAPLPAVCGAVEDSRVWKGRLASPPANLKYFVQAANGVGLVARSDNFGAYYGLSNIIPTATTLALTSAPASAIVGDSPTVAARLTYAGGVGLSGKIVAIGVGGSTRLGTTGPDGSVSVSMPVVADPGAYVINAAFAGDDVYQPSSASSPLTINRAAVTPTVLPAGAAVAGINVSGALGGTPAGLQQVPVTFTVVGPGGTTTVVAITDYLGNAIFPPPSGLPPGNYTVTGATFGGDGTYAPTTITFPTPLQVSVPKLNQSIDFDALAAKTFGDPDFGVFAAASSNLAVSYGATGNCTVVGGTVHLTGVGSCTITASQAGDATFNAAANVARTFAINPGAPTGPTVVSIVRAVPEPDDGRQRHVHRHVQRGRQRRRARATSPWAPAASRPQWSPMSAAPDRPRTVTVHTGRGTGTVRLDLNDGTGITNLASAPLTGSFPIIGEVFSVDKGGTVIGSGEGQLLTSFGSSGYALFSADPELGCSGASPGARRRTDPRSGQYRMRDRRSGRRRFSGALHAAAVAIHLHWRAGCHVRYQWFRRHGRDQHRLGTQPAINRRQRLRPRHPLQRDGERSFRREVHDDRRARQLVWNERRRHARCVAAGLRRHRILGRQLGTGRVRRHDARHRRGRARRHLRDPPHEHGRHRHDLRHQRCCDLRAGHGRQPQRSRHVDGHPDRRQDSHRRPDSGRRPAAATTSS